MIPIAQVDACTERPFGGNPAAVVLDAQRRSGAQMQAIAMARRVGGSAVTVLAGSIAVPDA